MKKGDRVRLINPEGYNNYQGTVCDIYLPGWRWIDWDCKAHPCTSPMKTKHLEIVKKKRLTK